MSEEGISNAGAHDNQAPRQDNRVPPPEEVAIADQVPVVPPPMLDGEISDDFLKLDQSMTSQANLITSQVQAMTTKVNREVGPRKSPHASTMASLLRDFNRMNPRMLYRSREDEYPQEFLDEVYKILLAMGVTT